MTYTHTTVDYHFHSDLEANWLTLMLHYENAPPAPFTKLREPNICSEFHFRCGDCERRYSEFDVEYDIDYQNGKRCPECHSENIISFESLPE